MMMPVRYSSIMTGTDHCIESHNSVALVAHRLHVTFKQRRRVPPVSGRSARATVRRRLLRTLAAAAGEGRGAYTCSRCGATGGGNHRGSVFRLFVGTALMGSDPACRV